MTKYISIKVKSVLTPSKLPDIDYALNPYIGCEHGCIYCYGPDFCRRYSEVAYSWGSTVLVKENLINVLKKDLRRVKRGVVGVSTITDPYQPVEATLSLTREAVRLLLQNNFKVSIQTKSPLLLRDLDILDDENVDVGYTITTLRDSLGKGLEPNAPPPSSRVKAVYEVSQHIQDTWIFLGPIIPMINDSEEFISEVVEFASSVNSYIIYDKLNIKPLMLYNMKIKWGFKVSIEEVISLSNDLSYIRSLNTLIHDLCKKYRVKCVPAFKLPT
jgi:DNA repair photolyase